MQRKYIYLLCPLFSVCLFFSSCSWDYAHSQLLESRTEKNDLFKIRVTSYGDRFIPASGAYYIFDSSTVENEWREIAVVHYDLPIPIDEDSLTFLSDRIAFVYMRWMFAVTIDGGETWTVWDSRKHKYLRDNITWGAIKAVKIGGDGQGEMTLSVSSGTCQTVITNDFGRTWVNGTFISKRERDEGQTCNSGQNEKQ